MTKPLEDINKISDLSGVIFAELIIYDITPEGVIIPHYMEYEIRMPRLNIKSKLDVQINSPSGDINDCSK